MSNKQNHCQDCGAVIRTRGLRCSACYWKRNRTNQCVDCGTGILKTSKRCQACDVKRRDETRKKYLCERCGGERGKGAGPHCMACSHEARREKYLAEASYTREEYEFQRSFGFTHHAAVENLSKSLGRSYREILRRLEAAPAAEEMAA